MSLSTFFTTIETDVSGFFKGLPAAEQTIITDLKPIFTSALGTFWATMMPTAISIVTDLATSGKTSNEKRNAAVSQVESAASTAGLAVLSGAANLVVEAAYSKLVATGALPTATPVPASPVETASASAPVNQDVPAPAGSTTSASASVG
jgi:hypothetical protein